MDALLPGPPVANETVVAHWTLRDLKHDRLGAIADDRDLVGGRLYGLCTVKLVAPLVIFVTMAGGLVVRSVEYTTSTSLFLMTRLASAGSRPPPAHAGPDRGEPVADRRVGRTTGGCRRTV